MTARIGQDTEVRRSVEVPVPPARAFDVFTGAIDRWWPRDYHLQSGELEAVGIDPIVGGRVWEQAVDGAVCVWGRVLQWDPPGRFGFTWRIPADYSVPADDAPESRVTVTFTPIEAGTRVEVVHDQLDAHGADWEALRDGVAGDGGWAGLLRMFGELVS
jgi:uncharacterized protein YndB with AHSA1/START domain